MYDDGSTESFPSVEELKAQVATISERCKPGHYFVLAYSGHGTNQENEEEQDGLDSILCLRTRDGENDDMVDDELAKLIAEAFDPAVTVLVLADACNSAGVLDCDTPGIWGKRHVVALSGCQNEQCSTDTGNGGTRNLCADYLKSPRCNDKCPLASAWQQEDCQDAEARRCFHAVHLQPHG